jgi:hypothetical protein
MSQSNYDGKQKVWIDLIRHPTVANPSHHSHYGPLQVSRHADLLRDVVHINKYESFCNTLDELFLELHEYDKKWNYVVACCGLVSVWIGLCVLFVVASPNYLKNVYLQFFCPFTTAILLLIMIHCHDYPARRIRKEIHFKCHELSKSTTMVNFQYVATSVPLGVDEFLQMGHIEVTLKKAIP